MRTALAAVSTVAMLAACGADGDEVERTTTTRPERTTTTTTTAPNRCPSGFRIPVEEPVEEECLEGFLEAAAAQQDLTLTTNADAQATALCREIGISGFVEAMTLAFLGWDEGSRPSPAEDAPGFAALAIGIYCPEFFDELRALNG